MSAAAGTAPTTPQQWLDATTATLQAFHAADPDGYARLRDQAIELAGSRTRRSQR